MSKLYATGEIAAMMHVTVRTIQYYDQKGLLKPAMISEGGRRLYGDEEVQRLQLILYFKELGFSLKDMREILSQENATEVVMTLLMTHKSDLEKTVREKQQQLDDLSYLIDAIETNHHLAIREMADVAAAMKETKLIKAFHRRMLFWGLLIDGLEWGSFIYALLTGRWYVFALAMLVTVAAVIVFIRFYYRQVMYRCPVCQHTFQPDLKAFIFAKHTPHTRTLVCPSCGQKSMCVEMMK